MYLPQYHCIPENDLFWGKGFTDWVTVRNAKPLYKGHNQPRIPEGNYYYDLSVKDDVKRQISLAKEYRIDGLGIYHYWFNNETNLLTKPLEIIHENKDLDMNYFLAWDNANWKRSWSNVAGNDWSPVMDKKNNKKEGPVILVSYIIGDQKDWENHYNAVRKYFLDNRYIKKGNKPLFVIFNYDETIAKMCEHWNALAKKDGFDGMFFVFRYAERYNIPEKEYKFKYEPLFSGWSAPPTLSQRIIGKLRRTFHQEKPRKYNYDKVWNSILENAKQMPQKEMLHGAFVAYDDTPRRGKRGTIAIGATPEKFYKYLSELVEISSQQEKDFVFLTAWNEWGEGAYLEPDTIDGLNYLQAYYNVKKNRDDK